MSCFFSNYTNENVTHHAPVMHPSCARHAPVMHPSPSLTLFRQRFQNTGVKITKIVNNSRRPISISINKSHLPPAGTCA